MKHTWVRKAEKDNTFIPLTGARAGDAICVNVCPANVFEMAPAPDHPVSDQKTDPVRQKDCIHCLTCQSQCRVQAIGVST